jgi:hypothetical protein
MFLQLPRVYKVQPGKSLAGKQNSLEKLRTHTPVTMLEEKEWLQSHLWLPNLALERLFSRIKLYPELCKQGSPGTGF